MGAFSVTFNATTSAGLGGGSGWTWSADTEAAIEDGIYATNNIPAKDSTEFINLLVNASALAASNVTVRVTGVLCEVLGYCDVSDSGIIDQCQLSDNSIPQGLPVSASKPLETSEGWGNSGAMMGGDGEMFGLTSAQILTLITSKKFGFQYLIHEYSGGTSLNIFMDSGRLTIYYDVVPKVLSAVGAGK